MTLHTKLVPLRKQKGLTQMDLAERLNISRQAVSRWESGAAVPSTDNLKVLSNLYGVSIDYLLNDVDVDPSKKVEVQEQESKEQYEKVKIKRILGIFACVVILVMVIATLIGAAKVQEREQEQIIPIDEMDTVIEDDYSVGTFSIE